MNNINKYKMLMIISYAILLYQIVLIFLGIVTLSTIGHLYDGLFVFSFLSMHLFIFIYCGKEKSLKEIRFKKKMGTDLILSNKEEYEEFLSQTQTTYYINKQVLLIISALFSLLAILFASKEIVKNITHLWSRLSTIFGISSILVIVAFALAQLLILKDRKKAKSQKGYKDYNYYVVFQATMALNLVFSAFTLQMLSNIKY